MKKIYTILMLLFCLAGLTMKAQVPQLVFATQNQNGGATIIKINADGTGYFSDTIDYAMTGDNWIVGSFCKANNGRLYGLTVDNCCNGFTYEVNPVNFTHHINNQGLGGGAYQGFLQANNGSLYYFNWTVSSSYWSVDGSIAKYDVNTDSVHDAFDFSSATTGTIASGTPIQVNSGLVYGTTEEGGTNNYGTLFSFDISTNSFMVIHNFDAVNRGGPFLIQVNNGALLYGMSSAGGANGVGNIFSFDTTTNTYINLHDFSTATGSQPYGKLLHASNGLLYGVTSAGGANNGGVIFSYNISNHTYTDLHDFAFATGWMTGSVGITEGGLMQASNGKLYGLVPFGGDTTLYNLGNGAFFSFDISTHTYTDIRNFVLGGFWSNPVGVPVEISNNSACNSFFTLHADTSQAHHYIGYNNSTGNGPLHYYWSWGDNTHDSTQFPSHVYADSGYYTICLTIADSTGCSSTYCDDSIFLQRTKNSMVTVNIIGTTLGINNPSSQPFTVKVYPNPANSILNIHQSTNSPNQLIITDLLGNEVYKKSLTCIDNTISISTWSAGI